MKKSKIVSFLLLVFLIPGCSNTSSFSDSSFSSAGNGNVLSSSSSSSDYQLSSVSSTNKDLDDPSIIPTSDPYTDVDVDAFYSDYKPATSYQDSVYRTSHHLMSGSISSQTQRPNLASYQPSYQGKYIRNATTYFNDDKTSYCLVDSAGNYVSTIYKGGGYITLNEVACYLYAFGDIPANYVSGKGTSPKNNPWGKYLVLNHSFFNDDNTHWLYEPDLPDAWNNNKKTSGTKKYYEIDIATTGTYEYSGNYRISEYNDGSSINRGGSRIVYTKTFKGDIEMPDPNDRYVFYTYNHYNDFSEFLNYAGGYGSLFGNLSGGGTLDNATNQYATSYPETIKQNF